MHDGEVGTSVELVARLISAQFPQWASLPIEPVPSAGTVNRIYRLGHDMSIRMPRVDWYVEDWERSQWLLRLAPQLPLPIPLPLARGEPGEGFPWRWSVYSWLDGETASIDLLDDADATARTLAEFLVALRAIDPLGGPVPGGHVNRGVPLVRHDDAVRAAIEQLHDTIDTDAATAAWERALAAPDWSAPPVWFHGDFYSGNMLAAGGEMSAIIDWGGMAVGDPACDLVVAWDLLPGGARETFRTAVGVDDATWERGRGWALFMGLVAMPYYVESNPPFYRLAKRILENALGA